MNDLFRVSGIELARRLRKREMSAQELVEEYIHKMKAVNPQLNAVVCERYDTAREEAKKADEQMASSAPEEWPEFLGVPCTVKESFALEGMPNSSGLLSRRDLIANEDAVVVERLRAAGAIPLGVTNTSELCMWMESNNRVYGRTNNPYQTDRIVGGSSGGEGAIVASGASPFGIGSDIGGSIRMPAFFNGVFGHKPSSCLVPNYGQFPAAENNAQRFLCTGPIARKAEDLLPLLRIFAGQSPKDKVCVDIPIGDPGSIKITDLTVISIPDNGRLSVAEDLRAAQVRALDAFRFAGARVQEVKLRGLKDALGIWACMMSEAADTPYVTHLKNGANFSLAREFFRLARGRSNFTLPSLGLVAVEKVTARMEKHSAKLIQAGKQLKAEMDEILQPNTLLLFPSYTRVTPPHNQPLRLPIQWQYTAIINVLELPATQIPLGLNSQGLPLGVQAIAAHGQDATCIAAAQFLEKEFGGWIAPRL